MAKSDKNSMSGFLIKLSCETVQKLTEQEHENKTSGSPAVPDANKPSQIIEAVLVDVSKPRSTAKAIEDVSTKSVENDNTTSNQSGEGKTWGDYAPYITYEGNTPIYTDPSTNQKYTWDESTSAWAPKAGEPILGREYSYEDDTHVYTEADGSKFFWDEIKKAWIPKVDDDFLAMYQMSYGFVDNTTKTDKTGEEKEDKKNEKQKLQAGVKRKVEPQWFDASDETNTKVYVSNLPQDMTEEEFVNLMQKCGLVEKDILSNKMKVKLYMDKESNCFKGDALCTYIKIESVDLALKLLDGSDYKGNKIKVERAHFQLKGEYNPALKPKKKKKKELEKIKKMQQKLFDWRPEKIAGERAKHERVVIVKNLFHPSDFDNEVQLILDYQQDLREECSKSGEVRKVVIYDRHPEGVAQITMKEPEMADAVVTLINGRWFGKRQITAEIWDGRTKYRIAETDADINKRINKWDKFLEGKDAEEPNKEPSQDTKESSQDTKESSQDTKESSQDTKESSQDTKESSQDTKESSQDTKESSLDTNEPSLDTKESSLDIKDQKTDTDMIPKELSEKETKEKV